jgi:hypothetical protein
MSITEEKPEEEEKIKSLKKEEESLEEEEEENLENNYFICIYIMNIKRWLLCAFLLILCFLFLRWLNSTGAIIEGYYGDPVYVYQDDYYSELY